jgi:hypothetical protein
MRFRGFCHARIACLRRSGFAQAGRASAVLADLPCVLSGQCAPEGLKFIEPDRAKPADFNAFMVKILTFKGFRAKLIIGLLCPECIVLEPGMIGNEALNGLFKDGLGPCWKP